jgi:hypothetical protein
MATGPRAAPAELGAAQARRNAALARLPFRVRQLLRVRVELGSGARVRAVPRFAGTRLRSRRARN